MTRRPWISARLRAVLPAVPAAALLAGVALVTAPDRAAAQDDDLDVPYVPTPMAVVTQMLELARPTADDSLYDLGSGDGRIVITAAARHGTPGVGIELDSGRVAEARRKADSAGVDSLVRFVRGDLFEADVRPATVVTLYLLSSVNVKLRPKLFRELRPGARVVSHDFSMREWQADSTIHMDEENSRVFFWIMPANVAGTWDVQLPSGDTFAVELEQRFQELRGRALTGGISVLEPVVRGKRIYLSLGGAVRDGPLTLEGTVSGDEMRGTTSDGGAWSATRTGGGGQSLEEW